MILPKMFCILLGLSIKKLYFITIGRMAAIIGTVALCKCKMYSLSFLYLLLEILEEVRGDCGWKCGPPGQDLVLSYNE